MHYLAGGRDLDDGKPLKKEPKITWLFVLYQLMEAVGKRAVGMGVHNV
jgi:hypothetical protein